MSTRAQEAVRANYELLTFPLEEQPHLVDSMEEYFTGFNDRDTDSEGSCKSTRIVCVCVSVYGVRVQVLGKRKSIKKNKQLNKKKRMK